MTELTRPLLAVYAVWHPSFRDGSKIAEGLRQHFRRKLYENVAGGTGLSVIFRSDPMPGSSVPLPIDITDAETSAIIVLVDPNLVNDPNWTSYVRDLAESTEAAGLSARVFPVILSSSALGINIEEQGLRWDTWSGTKAARTRRLIAELAYEFCRMLRHYLEHLKRPTEDALALERYLRKVQIFLSHSKHDEHGERIARLIREAIQKGHGLGSFFDVHDIPAGLRFSKVLLQQVRVSAVVAVHTDSYSSREWCRREIIEAKRWNVPLVVANSISDLDERGFPYMGNVPIVRMDPRKANRIPAVIGRLLDEVLKDFLWRCRVELVKSVANAGTIFVPRAPELISLVGLPPTQELPQPTIIYPDPPLSAEEERLFHAVAPQVHLLSFTEWLAEAAP
jgi:hypothetical protein